MLVLYPAGTGAQTNILPWLLGTSQPMLRRPPHRASRRRWYSPPLALHAVQRAGQGCDGNFLDGQEHTKIDLGAQFFTGGDHIGAPDQERNARAGHVEALAQGEELHRAFLGPRRIEDAAAVGTVKDDVISLYALSCTSKMSYLPAESNDLGVELRRADAAHRVGTAG